MASKRRKVITDTNTLTNKEIAYTDVIRRFRLYLESRNYSEVTIYNYQRNLSRFVDWLTNGGGEFDVRRLKTDDIERYISYLTLDKGLKPTTVNTALKSIKGLFNFISKTYHIQNITKDIHVVREDEIQQFTPTHEQMAIIYESLDLTLFNDLRNMTILKTIEHTGIRVNELVSLTIDDVNLKTNMLRVKKSKSRKERVIPINRTLHDVLKIYLKERGNISTDIVFISEDNKPLSVRGVSWNVKKVGDWVGIPITCHSLRRLFVTTLVKNGVSILVIQRLIGHSNLSQLHKYYSITPDQSRLAVNTLNRKKKG